MSNLAWIFVSTLLVNNFTLVMFLGLCSFFGVTAKIETAWRLGLANTFVLLLTAVGAWALNTYVLTRTPFLRTIAFIVVIASGVQIVEMAVKKYFPILFRQLGIYLPLITTNCAVLGIALLNAQDGQAFVASVLYGFGSALGFTLVMVLFAGMRERLALAQVPTAFAGTPIAFIAAGLLSLAFMGFAGLPTH
jgi:electron transport complex protein RnfA